jgi:hypothetical protein
MERDFTRGAHALRVDRDLRQPTLLPAPAAKHFEYNTDFLSKRCWPELVTARNSTSG